MENLYSNFQKMLYLDLSEENEFYNLRPKLFHYTSLNVLEKILSNNELWFSTPLNMNDKNEYYHVLKAFKKILLDERRFDFEIDQKDGHSIKLREYILDNIEYLIEHADNNIFLFCFSEHKAEEQENGKLSMWRGYGDDGKGVSLGIDTAFINRENDQPFIFAKIEYMTEEKISNVLSEKIKISECFIRKNNVTNSKILIDLSHIMLRRLLVAALFIKHIGFLEEQEWRVVYIKEFDKQNKFIESITYNLNGNNLYNIFKLDLKNTKLKLEDIVYKIILGPDTNQDLLFSGAKTMFKKIKKENLITKIQKSNIPYRPKKF